MKLIRKKHLIGLFVLCFVLFEALLSVNAATPSLSKSRYMKTYVLPIMSSLKTLIFQAFSNLLPHINRAKSDEQS